MSEGSKKLKELREKLDSELAFDIGERDRKSVV